MKLSSDQRKAITDRIEDLFEKTKARLLGRYFKGPKIYFQVAAETDPLHTLEGIYTYTLNMLYGTGIKPKKKNVRNLAEITSNYIDAQSMKVTNHVLADVAKAKNPTQAIKAISGHLDKAGQYVDLLVANETKIAQAYASREGITKLSSDIGVDDPTVVFLGIIGSPTRCKYCRKMYSDAKNEHIPIPYKLSEVNEGYFKGKLWDGKTPHQAPLHPSCREVMAFVPPNFGYTASGTIEFKYFGYDYHKDYWEVNKTEKAINPTDSNIRLTYEEYLEAAIEHKKEHSDVC
jgi:hypothetical protein